MARRQTVSESLCEPPRGMVDPNPLFPRPLIAVSACLLGQPVRYDGGHKRLAFLTDTLARHADYLPICPEAGSGMGTPRPPIHLVGDARRPRALGLHDPGLDATERLEHFATATLPGLAGVSGYVFKRNSPSCGLRRVKLFAEPGRRARRVGTGIFARCVETSLPLLPMEEEDGLLDIRRRDNFISLVYVYRRWQELQSRDLTFARLSDFHSIHKYLVMAHSRAACRRLEQLLALLPHAGLESVADRYIGELMSALRRPARRTGHYAVLRELADALPDRGERATLSSTLAAYRDGSCRRGEAIDVLSRAVTRRRAPEWIARQVYLHPYPDSLRQPFFD
jgi:uncharacterized protein YbbK (DUF523 family)/uncharacterized protein YbgA (DUF1722 family)